MHITDVDLYIASGNFHLFSAVCHRIHNCTSEKAILICLNHYNSDYLCNNLASSGLFEKIFNVDRLFGLEPCQKKAILFFKTLSKSSDSIRDYSFFFNNLIKSYGRIKHVYIPDSYRCLKKTLIHLKKKYNTKIYYIEGDGHNRHGFRDYNATNELYNILDGQFFFRPSVIDRGLPISRLIQGSPNVESSSKILSSFGYKPENDNLKDYNIIYLQGGFDFYIPPNGDGKQINEKEYLLCKKISEKYYGVACKMHPCSKTSYIGIDKYESCYPWEISILANNIENKLFIAHSSTTLLTPKYIMDKNPYVIFLYKIFGCVHEIQSNVSYEENLGSVAMTLYKKNPNKILIPETEAQIWQFLDRYFKAFAKTHP